ncbi:MAG: hypothetical protein WBM11_00895, partial [Terriglobales bacterium]
MTSRWKTTLILGAIIGALILAVPLAVCKSDSKLGSRTIHSWSVRWQPRRVANGSPVLLQVSSPQRLESLSGKWLDHE